MTVLVLMGVSGCGKSTVALALQARLGWDFAEGDALHPQANIDKMAAAQPLTDDDRWPWLDRVADWIGEHVHSGRPGLVTCSALKRRYRDLLRGDDGADVVFVHLHGTRDEIAARLSVRRGHYMPLALLDSQFADLEPPGDDENAVAIDIGQSPAAQADEIIEKLGLVAG